MSNEDTNKTEMYECENCGKIYFEALGREFSGEIGGIQYCPYCKEEVSLVEV